MFGVVEEEMNSLGFGLRLSEQVERIGLELEGLDSELGGLDFELEGVHLEPEKFELEKDWNWDDWGIIHSDCLLMMKELG